MHFHISVVRSSSVVESASNSCSCSEIEMFKLVFAKIGDLLMKCFGFFIVCVLNLTCGISLSHNAARSLLISAVFDV